MERGKEPPSGAVGEHGKHVAGAWLVFNFSLGGKCNHGVWEKNPTVVIELLGLRGSISNI